VIRMPRMHGFPSRFPGSIVIRECADDMTRLWREMDGKVFEAPPVARPWKQNRGNWKPNGNQTSRLKTVG
jgi:hypothetical protein